MPVKKYKILDRHIDFEKKKFATRLINSTPLFSIIIKLIPNKAHVILDKQDD